MSQIRKAVITAAGYGTRFLPATKNVPKELIPIINKPTIHYIVEQCIQAGIKDIIIVTRYGNTAIEDYFDKTPGLEQYLQEKGKIDILQKMQELYTAANFIFVRQKGDLPYGNGAPLYSAKDLLGDEPFLFSWGDEFILGEGAGVPEIIDDYNNNPTDIMFSCTEIPKREIPSKGILAVEAGTDKVTDIVEKPSIEDAPSNLAAFSPYILSPKVFEYLNPYSGSAKNEMFLMMAVSQAIQNGATARAHKIQGKWLDTGNPLNYVKTTIEMALARDDLREDVLDFLQARLEEMSKG